MKQNRWNLNIHYHPLVLDVAPPEGGTALDVGCGDGILAFDLADQGLTVLGVDVDEPSIRRATSDPRNGERTRFIAGDLFDEQLIAGSFDLVASVAMLHHVDAAAGLRRMKELVRPAGTRLSVACSERLASHRPFRVGPRAGRRSAGT